MFARQRRQAVDPVSGSKLSTSLVPLVPAGADVRSVSDGAPINNVRRQSQAAGLDLLSNLIHGESSHHLFKRHEWTPVTPANTDENDVSDDNSDNNHERSKSSEDSGESGGSEESSGSIDREEEVNPVDRLIVNEQSEDSEDSEDREYSEMSASSSGESSSSSYGDEEEFRFQSPRNSSSNNNSVPFFDTQGSIGVSSWENNSVRNPRVVGLGPL